MMKRLTLILTLFCLCLTGCTLPSQISDSPQAWIDAPLDGSVLPMSPYEIVIHTYAAGGSKTVELTINGDVVPVEISGSDGNLNYISYAWNPAEPGRYILAVRAQNDRNEWSATDQHIVLVEESTPTPTETPTPVFTDTPTPTLTSTLTETPTSTFTPTFTPTYTPTLVSGFAGYSVSGSRLAWFGSCADTTITLGAQVANPATVEGVYLFVRLRDWTSGTESPWNDGFTMNPVSDSEWRFNLSTTAIPGYTDYNKAVLVYQFVIQNTDGSLTRSPRIEDVTVGRCLDGVSFP